MFEPTPRPPRTRRPPAVHPIRPTTLRHPGHASPPPPPQVERFLRLVLERAGMPWGRYRLSPLLRRLPACLRALRVRTAEEAQALLEAHPGRWPIAIEALLIGTTGFFRDADVFACLDDMLAAGRVPHRSEGLRACSLACSDGAELYSLAMILDRRGLLAGSELLGIDLRASAVRRAQWGAYPAETLESVPPDLAARHLRFEPGVGQVDARLRRAVRWRVGDALEGLGDEGVWDLILCRNLAIYLEPKAAAQLWAAVQRALRPGGLLVTGKAERPVGAYERLAHCIYARTEAGT